MKKHFQLIKGKKIIILLKDIKNREKSYQDECDQILRQDHDEEDL